eukprot:jgi/Undpi1/2295/HiC_scaffold_13.g05679.m1
MIGRLFASHFWGLVSDRYGNRFVLIVGIVSNAVLSVAFGFSTTLTWAFTSRFLLGLFNGMMAASKTLVPHVCGKEHETVGMGVVTMAWSFGTVLGPGVGGILAQPAITYPVTFSKDGIFGRNPYLLPNVAAAGFTLLALPLVLIFIEEPRKSGNDGPTDEEQPKGHITAVVADAHEAKVAGPKLSIVQHVLSKIQKNSITQTEKTPMITRTNGSSQVVAEPLSCNSVDVQPTSLLAQPHIRTLLFIDMLFSLSYAGFDEVFSLWCLSTVDKGGLDWSTVQIGQMFLAAGAILLVLEMVAVPTVLPRMGIKAYQRVGSIIHVPAYMLIPMLSSRDNAAGLPVAAASLILLCTCYFCTNSFYVGISVAVNNATGPERRGELNGIAAAVTAFTKALSPVLCSVLFAFSIDGNKPFPFDYHFVFYLLTVMRLVVAWMGWNKITNS